MKGLYDYENGYAVTHTPETVEHINSQKAGRPKVRYNVVKRDGNMTVVHHNLTKKSLKQSPTKSMECGYNALWKAVILQAVADYRKHPEMQSEVARFFRSNYFKMITEVDGECIVSRLKAEIKNKG